MNVLELLDNELKNKRWTLEQKARFLYLRSCKLFSFDPRYKFCGTILNGQKLENELRRYTFDLENVENFEVICTSHINNVYPRLLKELLGIEADERGSGHKWAEFYDGTRTIKADPTCSDLTNVKTGLSTRGYHPLTKEYMYNSHLFEIDKKINYVKEEYQNEYIKRQIEKQLQEYICEHQEIQNTDDYLIFKMNILQEFYRELEHKLKNISDQELCITHLEKELEIDLNTIQLYHIDEQERWHFLNIYLLRLQNEILYYLLEKGNLGFDFYEIQESDALHYARTLKGTNKDILFQNKN